MRRTSTMLCLAGALMLAACPGPQEAPRAALEVFTDGADLEPVVTDTGWRVELTEARLVVETFEFTVAGELHTSFWDRVSGALYPTASAHPGHHQGGDVTGELRGRFVVDWVQGNGGVLGEATLLAGAYEAANFTFARGEAVDGITEDDPLFGHTALLRGTATKGEEALTFVARIVSPVDRLLVGAPFELEVDAQTDARLGFRLMTRDPHEGDTLFDGLDFGALDLDGDGAVTIEPGATESAVVDAYNLLRRTFQTHDHFSVSVHER